MSSPRQFRLRSLWQSVRLDLLLWVACLCVGFKWILSYEMKAGESAPLLSRWPSKSGLNFDPGRYNLVMFAHPKCPCSRASLADLEEVLVQAHGKIHATVCFIDPEDAPADWADTGLERSAKAIPGVEVVLDKNDTIAQAFGAMTSGQVVMFDSQGRGLFSGGVTAARGHAGINHGSSVLVAMAEGELSRPEKTPVFGCALHNAPMSVADSQ